MSVDLPPPVRDTPAPPIPRPPTTPGDSGGSLPSPPPSDGSVGAVPQGTRPGDITLLWRMVLLFGWIAAFFAYAAVWQASVQLGIATWWVGPRSQPTPTMIRMIPFILSIAAGLFVVYNVRWLSRFNLGFASASILIALPDFSRSVGLAVVEVMISGAVIVLAIGSMTGRYRLGFADADQSDLPAAGDDEAEPGDGHGTGWARAEPSTE